MSKHPVAIVGASGYSGEELVRLLVQHPGADLVCVTSRQYEGRVLSEIQKGLRGHPVADALRFSAATAEAVVASGARTAFLALPHGLAAEFARPLLAADLRVIDLSADFRIKDPLVYREFYGKDHPAPGLLAESVYGLPEANRESIRAARLVASPGCYPTSILIPLLPLLRAGAIEPDGIVANSLSGVSGAGRKADISLLFAECNESVRAYGLPGHRHLPEIEQELGIAAAVEVRIAFHPHLIPVNRGICSTITARRRPDFSGERLGEIYHNAYAGEPFVRLLPEGEFPDIKHVVRTNCLDLAWRIDERTGHVILLSAEDNLMKGAGGQAIQSFNIQTGQPETSGLV